MAMCKGVASHFPEWLLRINDIDEADTEFVHSLCKRKFKISSTAFDNMKENDVFHEYHVKCRYWIATYILNCIEEKLDEKLIKKEIKVKMDYLTNQYIDDKDIK